MHIVKRSRLAIKSEVTLLLHTLPPVVSADYTMCVQLLIIRMTIPFPGYSGHSEGPPSMRIKVHGRLLEVDVRGMALSGA